MCGRLRVVTTTTHCTALHPLQCTATHCNRVYMAERQREYVLSTGLFGTDVELCMQIMGSFLEIQASFPEIQGSLVQGGSGR